MTTRREFLQQGVRMAAGLGTVALASELSAQQDNQNALPIIDTHVHIWDLQRLRLPWIEEGTPLHRNFTPQDYQQATRGQNVVKAVYVEVAVDPSQHLAEAEYIANLCQQGNTPFRAAVIGGNPDADNFADYVRRFRGHRYIKGVRRVLHAADTPRGHGVRPEFVRGVRLLGENGLTFDLCMRHSDLDNALTLVQSCPDTRFVLDHCGNPDLQARDHTNWRRDIDRLARSRNIVCKVSGIPFHAPENWTVDTFAPIINHILDSFGPDRVMFAADWPVCTRRTTFAQWVNIVQTLVRNRPLEQQRKLFHDNAARFYGI